MRHLTSRERELVALGTAVGSNFVSCIEYHIPASRKAGLTVTRISEAIRLTDKIRQVPARKVLDAAFVLPDESYCSDPHLRPGVSLFKAIRNLGNAIMTDFRGPNRTDKCSMRRERAVILPILCRIRITHGRLPIDIEIYDRI